ncbi:unnamed protein product, partial [Symbiodinium microadriaticum]
MAGRLYSGPVKKNRPLLQLVREFALDLASCYDEPISLPMSPEFGAITLVPLGLKGDLVALVKLAGLTRNFQRDTWSNEDGPGICHLCSAGQLGHSWHDISYENMLLMRQDSTLPWVQTPSLIAELPVDPRDLPGFFRLDVFHIMHKGNDTTSLCVYLEAKLKNIIPTISDDVREYFTDMLLCVENGNKLMRLMYHCQLWLSKSERSSMIVYFRKLLTGFASCAQHAYNRQMCRFKLQPKFHFAGEVLFGLEHNQEWSRPSLNPISTAVQMDEDYIGRICSIC